MFVVCSLFFVGCHCPLFVFCCSLFSVGLFHFLKKSMMFCVMFDVRVHEVPRSGVAQARASLDSHEFLSYVWFAFVRGDLVV